MFGFPMVNRQTKGTFGNEFVAFYRFIRNRDKVGLGFVIPRKDNHIALVFQSDLCRPNDVSCWMKTHLYVIDGFALIVAQTLNRNVFPNSMLQNGFGVVMAEVMFVSPSGVIGVTMRNDGVVYRIPRIQIEFPWNAINTFFCELQ